MPTPRPATSDAPAGFGTPIARAAGGRSPIVDAPIATSPAEKAAAAVAPPPVPLESLETDRIRSTLAGFETAYSKLNARAARDVWPTVDERALSRAFEGLKSQEIAFDRCQMVVKGSHASAACEGRATYVPRVGSQSPRTNAHEWKFTLEKIDEQWKIASASFR